MPTIRQLRDLFNSLPEEYLDCKYKSGFMNNSKAFSIVHFPNGNKHRLWNKSAVRDFYIGYSWSISNDRTYVVVEMTSDKNEVWLEERYH